MFLGGIICCRFSSVLHTDMIIIKLNTCIFKNVEEEEINPLPICTLKYSMYLTMHTKNKYIQNQNKETHKHFHLHTLIGANIYTKPHGYSGSFSAMESHEKKPPSFPHHACDSALFTLSWRVAPFDQAGEALGWVVVLTKSQCAVCRQGNFPG